MLPNEVTIGIVGLGRMGGNMARNLLEADYEVIGYDVSSDSLADFEDNGGDAADTQADIPSSADILISSLPNPETVRSVYLGDEGIVQCGESGLVSLEMSTIDPETAVEISREAKSQGISVLGAPVSGGPEEARNGTLSLMVGGDQEVFQMESIQAVLGQLGKDVHYTGDVDAGYTVKLINNIISMTNLLIIAEALTLGAARDVDVETILEAVSTSGGSSNQLLKRGPKILNRNFEGGFSVDLGKKDIGLALDTAEEMNQSMIATSLVHGLYTQVSADGHGDEDIGAIAKLYEARRGVTLEADGQVDETFDGY